jgi:ADP-ribose pyrophosphatase YjhB (NUDIX family)
MLKKAIRRLYRLISPDTRAWLVRSTQSSFTASAAAIILNEKKEVLLLNHVLRPYSGWGIPGGFIDKGEQAEDAIRREIREEIGIEISRLQLYTIRTIGSHLEILFFAQPNGQPKIRSAEIMELRWYGREELPEETAKTHGQHIDDAINGW